MSLQKLIILCFSLASVMSLKTLELTQEEVTKCIEKSNANLEEFAKIQITDVPSKEVLCMAKCVLEMKNLIDSNGNLMIEEMKKYKTDLTPEMQGRIGGCVKKVGKIGSCEDLETYRKCLVEA